MTNVQALVASSAKILPSMTDLLGIYEGYIDRPKKEQARMKRLLAFKAGEGLINSDALFSLPEVRDPLTNYPVVALAPMHASRIRFFQDENVAGFHTSKYSLASSTQSESSFFSVPFRSKPETEQEKRSGYISVYRDSMNLVTSVPPTPRSVAPLMPWTRRKCYVLFDANWQTLPFDPYLLERVSYTQFRIVGHWDLSDKERELMRMMGL